MTNAKKVNALNGVSAILSNKANKTIISLLPRELLRGEDGQEYTIKVLGEAKFVKFINSEWGSIKIPCKLNDNKIDVTLASAGTDNLTVGEEYSAFLQLREYEAKDKKTNLPVIRTARTLYV